MTSRRAVLGWLAAGSAALVLVGALGACTSSGGGGSASVRAAAGDGAANAAAVPSPPKRAVADSTASGGRAERASAVGLDLGAAKIRIATMHVQVKRGQSVAGKADAAETIATAVGGEVDSDDREAGRSPSATLLLRVPPESLTSVLRQLSGLGVEKSRELSTRDVTSKVADVASRVASARDAIARLRVLYRHATKVGNIIAIESELSERESNLESLQAQARALAGETSTAAITVSLTSAPKKKTTPPPVKKDSHSGFVGGLLGGWHAFTSGAVVLATVVGAVLPFAVVLAVIALLGRLAWTRFGRRREDPASS